jgi:hypothetical protein
MPFDTAAKSPGQTGSAQDPSEMPNGTAEVISLPAEDQAPGEASAYRVRARLQEIREALDIIRSEAGLKVAPALDSQDQQLFNRVAELLAEQQNRLQRDWTSSAKAVQMRTGRWGRRHTDQLLPESC